MATKKARKRVRGTSAKAKSSKRKTLSGSYDSFKEFGGRDYTGMKVGRSHKWYYDKGEWKETKITPDLWEISYAVTKRRAGRAPAGSGVPVGTEYQWYILAHQHVEKLNANDYTTSLTGLKYKLAHKRSGKDKWSATAKTQKKRLIGMMKELISELEKEPIPLSFDYEGKTYKGEAVPVAATCSGGTCGELEISINNKHIGIIKKLTRRWKIDGARDAAFVNTIGKQIEQWFND